MSGTISGSHGEVILTSPGYKSPVTVIGGATIDATTGYHALYASASWTVVNQGLIEVSGIPGDPAISLVGGGSVTNATGGTISGTGFGVNLSQPGAVSNASGATIEGDEGIRSYENVTVVNSGLISATRNGVYAYSGLISNAAGGVITAAGGVGVNFLLYGTVVNAGTIAGLVDAVSLNSNFFGQLLAAYPGAVFQGTIDGGIPVGDSLGYWHGTTLELAPGAQAGTLSSPFTNFGYITFDAGAKWLLEGGAASLPSGEIFAGFSGGDTIEITGTAASYIGFAGGVLTLSGGDMLDFAGPSTPFVSNDGTNTTITASVGTITGTHSAGITLAFPSYIDPITVANTATIAVTADTPGQDGLYAASPWTVVNEGVVAAIGNTAAKGIFLAAGGLVSNAAGGTISAAAVGVALFGDGTVSNAAGGTITAAGSASVGVSILGLGTVVNAGTIGGGTDAVSFGAGYAGDRLLAVPGAVFQGTLDGGNPVGSGYVTTLELAAGVGTLATPFTNFGAIQFDTGAEWLIAGGSAALASGETITGFTGGDAIELLGTAATYAGLAGTILTLSGGDTLNFAGLVAGTTLEVSNDGANTTITDAVGTITGLHDAGVTLTPSVYLDPVTVAGGAAINVTSASPANALYAATSWSVVNEGLVAASGNTFDSGVFFNDRGYLTNELDSTVEGAAGVFARGGGTIVNAGTIIGTAYGGINELVGGSVLNTGLIRGGSFAGNAGVEIFEDGFISNAAGATITATGSQPGVAVNGLQSVVVNAGTIGGGGTLALTFAPGTFGDRLVVDPGAVFLGTVDGGNTVGSSYATTLQLAAGNGTLAGLGSSFINFGEIDFDTGATWEVEGSLAALTGGEVIRGFVPGDAIELVGVSQTLAGSYENLLTLSGGATVDIGLLPAYEQAQVTGDGSNTTITAVVGTITGTHTAPVSLSSSNYAIPVTVGRSAVIDVATAGQDGITAATSWTVVNQGSVAATGQGGSALYLRGGGSVTNATDAYISGAALGIALGQAGYVTNAGGATILSGAYGAIHDPYSATILNAGLISGGTDDGNYGVLAADGSTVSNAASGTITARGASSYGVRLKGGTVINAGTIGGGAYAVRLYGGETYADDRVVVDPGAVFLGTVAGGGGTLELAPGTATLAGLGYSFNDFGLVTLDPGAQWLIEGNASGLASGATVAGFSQGDTIEITGTVETLAAMSATALTFTGGGTLNLPGMAGGTPNLSNDGVNTFITPAVSTITGTVIKPVTLTTDSYANPVTVGGGATVDVTSAIPGYNGIVAATAWTVVNQGLVEATTQEDNGVDLRGGGLVANATGGTISGPLAGVQFNDANGTVSNASGGTILGSTYNGIETLGQLTVDNAGMIAGGTDGIFVLAASLITNEAGGVITAYGGGSVGLDLSGGPATLVNAGTIGGGAEAVSFNSRYLGNRLVVEPGATFQEGIAGGLGTLELAPGTMAGTLSSPFDGFGVIAFDAGASWLVAGSTAALAGGETITGFVPGDTLELAGAAENFSFFGTYSGYSLLVLDGGSTLDLVGVTALTAGQVTNDGTNTFITACFATGTGIATARGQVPVEALRKGELVLTATGRLAPILWLGRRRTDLGRHPSPHDVMPVRVREGAFGDNLPSRDLILSPDHAVFVDGHLVPIRHLINNVSIVQQTREAITYWHVELDRHDIILAEGMACESYLDTGNRSAFEGEAAVMLHADFARAVWATQGCAPILTDPADHRLRALHTRLLARAQNRKTPLPSAWRSNSVYAATA